MSHHEFFRPGQGDSPALAGGNGGFARLDLCHRQTVSLGARALLSEVATACFAFGAYKRCQHDVGARFGRSVRQVQRWADELVRAGLVKKIRRGKKLSNVLLLAKGFFTKLARMVQRPRLAGRPEIGARARLGGFLRGAWNRRVKGAGPPGLG